MNSDMYRNHARERTLRVVLDIDGARPVLDKGLVELLTDPSVRAMIYATFPSIKLRSYLNGLLLDQSNNRSGVRGDVVIKVMRANNLALLERSLLSPYLRKKFSFPTDEPLDT